MAIDAMVGVWLRRERWLGIDELVGSFWCEEDKV